MKFDLHDGGEKEIIFQIGNEENAGAAIALISKFAESDAVTQSLQNVKEYWENVLSTMKVTTPDKSLNILTNGWLTYQTMSCRIFARSGFYQSGGAFGFRDHNLFAQTCFKEATALQSNIEASGWDGQRYLRAYFDDGTPLGSRVNDECRIDAIAQSWSVLSGAAKADRKFMAMASLDKYLVNRDLKLIQLLEPPFDARNGRNPGYIKGYVPGVRENGGQYSHAAIWALMAFAALGNRDKVWELFSMIHPLSHSSDTASMQVYKVEPYMMAADIYATESHQGRGGGTWYTGSSGWMYQFIISSLLGIELLNDHLKFRPCFPLEWPSVSIVYRYGKATYNITVFQLNDHSESWWKIKDTKDKISYCGDRESSSSHCRVSIWSLCQSETLFPDYFSISR